MKKYNTRKRAQAHTQTQALTRAHLHNLDGYNEAPQHPFTHFHARPRYDTYNSNSLYTHTRWAAPYPQPHAHLDAYIATHNLDAIFTGKPLAYKPTAPYRAHPLVPSSDPYTRPEPPAPTTHTDTRTAKVILYTDDPDNPLTPRIAWYGYARRTLTYTDYRLTDATLTRNHITLTVRPYIPPTNTPTFAYTLTDLRKHGVECYIYHQHT